MHKYDMSCTNTNSTGCPDEFGCLDNVCPDFLIRRHDSKPDYRILMEDCNGPMDLTDLVLEATMWANSKLKSGISNSDNAISLADGIGFNQVSVGDLIVADRPRGSERMIVTSFDEDNRIIYVNRAQDGTTAQNWKKGTPLKIIKFMNAPAKTEMIYEDVLELDGTVKDNVLQESYFVYEWSTSDTSLPGCYYLEFKLIKIDEWIRRFPNDKEGFLIKITDTFTIE
jgi:hypothetical protein